MGVVVAAGAIAGCGGDGGDGGDGTSDGGGEGGGEDTSPTDTPTGTPTATATPTAAETETPTAAGSETPTATQTATATGDGNAAVDEYLSDVGNYDGSVADMTGQGEVVVDVGAQGNGGGFAFGPPAVRIETGTTVVWEWTGMGGLHNVVAEDGTFESGGPVTDPETTFEYTFSESGTWLYFCNPHKALGMKGAVVVE